MSEIPTTTPAPANLVASPAEFSWADEVRGLLSDERLHQFSPEEQGKAIVDRFVGELVARNGVTSSRGEQRGPYQILEDMDYAATRTSQNKGSWEENINLFTRTDGLRTAVQLLSADERTGGLFGDMRQRLAVKDNQIAFTSITQVAGYLDSKSQQANGRVGSFWQSELLEAVNGHAFSHPGTPSRWQSNDLLSSDVALVRDEQKAFEQAAQGAKIADVDHELLARSAEEIKRRAQSGQYIGQTIAATTVAAPNYDDLFRP